MKRTLALWLAILAVLTLYVGAGAANGQVFRRIPPAARAWQANQPVQAEQLAANRDVFLANWIGTDNQIEISLSQFAGDKASSQEVKEFAQEMIRAHTDLAKKLNQMAASGNAVAARETGPMPYTAGYSGQQGAAAAPGTTPGSTFAPPAPNAPQGSSPPAATQGSAAGKVPAAAPAPAQQTPEGITGGQLGAAATTPSGPGASTAGTSRFSPLNFKREIDGHLVALIEQKLGQEKGQQFDRCFMRGQVVGHVHMLASLQVAANQASPRLKPILDEAIQVAQQHLSQAESLAKKLESREVRDQ